MRVEKAMLAMVAACGVLAWDMGCEAATTAAVQLCGRKLSEIMSRVCHEYNSPAWDDPSEQPAGVLKRRRREVGIADQCCSFGCTWEQLTEYCAISSKLSHPSSETAMDTLAAHQIADRSAERGSEVPAPAVVGAARGEAPINNVVRAAPVVGTVSPLLMWGRTLHSDLPPAETDRYAYVAIYNAPKPKL